MKREKTEIKYILLAICTYKRPNMCKNAILSVNNLTLPQNINVELLVADNDFEGSAKSVVSELQNQIPLKIHYVVEKNRGLSNARNRVLEESIKLGATHISMLDDDEILTENSLIAHVNLYDANEDCFISSGIVLNKFLPETKNYIRKNIVFKQKTTKKTGTIKSSCASGNVFIPVDMVKENPDLRFSSEFQLMGGEDGEFFSRASKMGYTIVQNSESLIYEDVSKERATVSYLLRRSYYNGYSGSYLKFKEDKSFFKVFPYLFKLFIVFIFNLFCLIPSLLFGLTLFFNVLSMSAKTFGKIKATLLGTPLNFYSKTYGN